MADFVIFAISFSLQLFTGEQLQIRDETKPNMLTVSISFDLNRKLLPNLFKMYDTVLSV